MMVIILENALDTELDEELSCSQYDYRNKNTDNSRNGHSQKTMHTSYSDIELDILKQLFDNSIEFVNELSYVGSIVWELSRYEFCIWDADRGYDPEQCQWGTCFKESNYVIKTYYLCCFS